eukprot:CAMPEP_0176006220 /NCGR_PEP_ID=MMETSP0120_2-20121206/2608_1 /TAXON_ID=160619 /ORGANISM="Kryptoperidinium foliaceum, Strain CCMP 1326" /LENGTH=433 /DNA_ID=CAMNT_0017338949 /DNA_START=1 /DNA_END=1302 /DNA_ORIENTATION=+
MMAWALFLLIISSLRTATEASRIRSASGTPAAVVDLPVLPGDVVRRVLLLLKPLLAVSWGGNAGTLGFVGGDSGGTFSLGTEISKTLLLAGGERLVAIGPRAGIVWQLGPLRRLSALRDGHARTNLEILDVRAFPDGERLITLGTDQVAVIWHVVSGSVLRRLDLYEMFAEHRFVRVLSGDVVVTGVSFKYDDPCVIWNATTGGALRSLMREGDRTRYLEASTCGRKVATLIKEGILLWDVASGSLEHVVPLQRRHFASCGIFVSSMGALVISQSPARIQIWSSTAEQQLRFLDMNGFIVDAILLPGESQLAAFSTDEAIVWDIASGEVVSRLDQGAIKDAGGDWALAAAGLVVAACESALFDIEGHFWHDRMMMDEFSHPGLGEELVKVVTVRAWDIVSGRLLHEAVREDSGTALGGACSIAVASTSDALAP